MVGIRSMGIYIPRYRLERNEISRAMGGISMSGEKAVCNFDEDSVTMAVEALRDSLREIDSEEIDSLLFASTSAPYKEKQSSSTIAMLADLKEDIFTSDFSNSIRSGASALEMAMARVKSGMSKNVAVTVSDDRLGVGGSDFEKYFGDGAVALVLSSNDLIATIEGVHTINDDFLDVWRTSTDIFASSWEDRFVKTKGFENNIAKVVKGLMDKYNLLPSDFDKVVLAGPDYRIGQSIGKSLGFDITSQLQNNMFDQVGNIGTAHPFLMLFSAINEAKPGDKILLTVYGDGAMALILSVTNNERVGNAINIKEYLYNKLLLKNYEEYLKIKNLIVTEADRRPSLPSSVPHMWRERNYFTRFHGVRCFNCGTEQYPRHRICYHCKSKDNFEEIKLSLKKGTVITYTKDRLFPTKLPPHVQAVIELEGGCRAYMMMTDVDPDEVKSHMLVDMVPRVLHERSNFYNYGWKCKPSHGKRNV